jgi:hypothetical protein
MSRILKVALVVAVAAVAIGATQIVSHPAQTPAFAAAEVQRPQVSPAELTERLGVLPQMRIYSDEFVSP